MLCVLAKHFTLTVKKMGIMSTGKLSGNPDETPGVTLQWMSLPSRGE